MVLQLDNSVLSKSCIQEPKICFCMFCSLRYRLCWNQSFSDIYYFCLSRWSIVLLCARISTWCFEYQTCKTNNSWCSIDAHFQDPAGGMLLLFLCLKATNISSTDVCNESELRLPKMRILKLVMLCWRLISEWGSDCVAVSWPINAANASDMPNSNQITIQLPYLQNQKSLKLRWCSSSKWGSDRVAFSFARESCQLISYP